MSFLFFLLFSTIWRTEAQMWIAAFFNQTELARCQKLFDNGGASFIPQCEHHTLVFNPPSLGPYEKYFGEKQLIRVLAVAEDEHGKALLIHSDQGNLHTANRYPHVTVFNGPSDPYGAVYSNVLWERFESTSPITIKRGADSYPIQVNLTSSSGSEWSGNLPAFLSKIVPLPNGASYPATTGSVYVDIEPAPTFAATVCLNSYWDGNFCNIPTVLARS
eukprot:TRINITY_DN743_c0_g1_i7.p1 TRINITY_DN743_c0_g1~~TRINITY_DN743_c0_g1_i7.p1  ORF type:complete len:218 (+),score=8.58 TRINITY_DN743_c0_g1_i7:12-665(+)